ncbi:MAG TPA: cytochrome c3 family protein [Pyrinomonadaceae bacterium]
MHEPLEQHPSGPSATRASRWRRWLSLAAIASACLVFALTLLLGARASTAPAPSEVETSTGEIVTAESQADYSRFTHTNAQHARLPCALCHKRDDNSPRPVRSVGHTPCSGCHTQQFADTSSPICTICHADPQSGAVKPFPTLRSFNVRFDHATHARGGARPASNCSACHRPERRGVALSIPISFGAHTTCFQCHTPGAQAGGQDISSCNTCHNLGGYRRTPETAPAFRVNFSHAEHTRKGLGCNECHTVRAGAPQGRQVTSPQPLMHHASPRAQSCMTCHNDRRAFGGDDFSDCKRCHEGNTWHF